MYNYDRGQELNSGHQDPPAPTLYCFWNLKVYFFLSSSALIDIACLQLEIYTNKPSPKIQSQQNMYDLSVFVPICDPQCPLGEKTTARTALNYKPENLAHNY